MKQCTKTDMCADEIVSSLLFCDCPVRVVIILVMRCRDQETRTSESTNQNVIPSIVHKGATR